MKLTRRDFFYRVRRHGRSGRACHDRCARAATGKTLRIGIIWPRFGARPETRRECGNPRGQWQRSGCDKDGGIAGRMIELGFEEETNPRIIGAFAGQ